MKNVRELAILSMLTAILFIQEELLSFLPNIQLTFFLIILYSCVLGFSKTLVIILVHTLLDNLVMGSFNIFMILPMFLGYFLIDLIINVFKVKNNVALAFLSIVFSIIYALLFIPTAVFIYDFDFKAYILADIPFDLILICTNFLLVLWLLKPLEKLLNNLYSAFIYKKIEESDNYENQ